MEFGFLIREIFGNQGTVFEENKFEDDGIFVMDEG